MIVVKDLSMEYPESRGRIAVDGINFSVPEGELRTLLGPSGCGKTTTLRMLAGLERPTSGEIWIGDTLVYSSENDVFVPPNRRKIGMVFQSYAIWPHMTVFENVAFPLRVSRPRVAKSEIRERTRWALESVGLAEFADRPGLALSGGQQQRAVLARALVNEPDILLLDEPLSNLDVKLRERMRVLIREVQQRTGLTTIFVTHDQSEALAISDQIAVMDGGHIVEVGEPQQLYQRPVNRFTAGFIGTSNVLSGTVVAVHDPYVTVATPGGQVTASIMGRALEGDTVEVYVRSEDVEVTTSPGSASWSGILTSSLYQGSHWDCTIEVGAQRILARVPEDPKHLGGSAIAHVRFDPDRSYAVGTGREAL